jgi:hypothetical protein
VSEKTLFSIFLPATGLSYDVWIPKEISVYDATQLVSRLLAERESRFFVPSGQTALYNAVDGAELRGDACIGNLGLSNGTRLILI